jgi:hypothetical protein
MWYKLHGVSQRLMTLFVGLHIAINWRWITTVALGLCASKRSPGRSDVSISAMPVSTEPKVNT